MATRKTVPNPPPQALKTGRRKRATTIAAQPTSTVQPTSAAQPTDSRMPAPKARAQPTEARTPAAAARPDAAAPRAPVVPVAAALAAATRFPIVALGASAGGLEAYEDFFRAMPPDSGMGFVLVQHLDPSHESLLVEILQRSTRMPVVEATDQMPVQPDRVHVIPPNKEMGIFHGALQLSPPSEPRGQRLTIDAFLRSLAEDQGESAAAVILSGTGSDGTLGLRAVHAAGGLCLVQEPTEAKYDGMPRHAVQSGYVSQVLPVGKMPAALKLGLQRLPIGMALGLAPAAAPSGLNQVLMVLRSATGHDFSLYKRNTIARRVERRMLMHDFTSAAEYVRYLREQPTEVRALFRELLINVTSFFRDPEAWLVLKAEVLPGLLQDRLAGSGLRIWVAGCATGEEAYSLAIVLRELLHEGKLDLKVQIYATDLDDEAITQARAGLYPPNISQDVSPERLRRFFVLENGQYRVTKEIREMLVFAVHNVIKDPPFTKLDLVACRNVMIYLEPELQDRLLPALHYALKPGGVLFLSPSESIGSHTELFEPLSRKWKLFRARATTPSARSLLGGNPSQWSREAAALAAAVPPRPARESLAAEMAKRTLLQSFAPAAVLTDTHGTVLYVNGEIGKFLRPAPGNLSVNVVDMAREGLQKDLRAALREAVHEAAASVTREVLMRPDGHPTRVNLGVRLLPSPDPAHNLVLISFEEPPDARTARKPATRPGAKVSGSARRIQELELELAEVKERMKTVLEERLIVTEELKSGNEELQSANEELQSTNEELETSKEELQSVNEELVTLNAELQMKVDEVTRVQDDMKNLLDNMRVGTIFLDRHLLIRRFNRDAVKVYRLVPADLGRPLADIRSELKDGDLLADAQSVLETLVPVEREVSAGGGLWYLARLQPYRTMDNVIDGVVITFTDMTERVEALAARKARDLAEAVIDTVRDPLVVLDAALVVMSANRAFYEEFGGGPETTLAHRFFEINQRRWDFPVMHELLDTPLPANGVEHRSLVHEFVGIGQRHIECNARRIGTEQRLVLLTIAQPVPGRTAVP